MVLHRLLRGEEPLDRWRGLEEWNRWLLLGSDVATRHPDFPQPLIVEIETYRGCPRYASGGCSFCVEPMKGAPVTRDEEDIIRECAALREAGVRNFRLGAQTCIISYKADMSSDPPRPNPAAVERLFSGIAALGPDVLHVDNANPAVIASYPEESREVLGSLVRHCTGGNVLALGLESADPAVREANNLNATAEQAMDAIRMINEVGGAMSETGLPRLLPGLNLIIGLDGETSRTLELDRAFLKEVLDSGCLLRRLNIRQVMPLRRDYRSPVTRSQFIRFKESVREDIDRPMLQRLVPAGTVLRNVYTEAWEGNVTFGRQIGSYPLLVGFPYPIDLGRFVDATVLSWGHRSITAVERPLGINSCSLAALEALPGVGRKRAIRLFRKRPLRSLDDLVAALDDRGVAEGRVVDEGGQRPLLTERRDPAEHVAGRPLHQVHAGERGPAAAERGRGGPEVEHGGHGEDRDRQRDPGARRGPVGGQDQGLEHPGGLHAETVDHHAGGLVPERVPGCPVGVHEVVDAGAPEGGEGGGRGTGARGAPPASAAHAPTLASTAGRNTPSLLRVGVVRVLGGRPRVREGGCHADRGPRRPRRAVRLRVTDR